MPTAVIEDCDLLFIPVSIDAENLITVRKRALHALPLRDQMIIRPGESVPREGRTPILRATNVRTASFGRPPQREPDIFQGRQHASVAREPSQGRPGRCGRHSPVAGLRDSRPAWP